MDGNGGSDSYNVKPVVTHVSSHESITAGVVSAVAKAKGVAPDEIGPPYRTIDPDALNRLFRRSGGFELTDIELIFTVENVRVTVFGDGRIACRTL